MNNVREIQRINEKELDLALSGASWHDEYKDSAYVFAGGLNTELTEGDVITIFSQYGEVMDINMPRDKETGKSRGFAFLMYEDQRSTVLAVDNLNGAKVLERILRVDHVKDYKQSKVKNEDGEMIDREEQSLNAKPELITGGGEQESESDASSGPEIDPEDPMYEYLVAQRKEAKAAKKAKKSKSKSKRVNETEEERRARKERKRAKKEKKARHAGSSAASNSAPGHSYQEKSIEELLQELEGQSRPHAHDRYRSRTPPRHSGRRDDDDRTPPRHRSSPQRHARNTTRSRSRSTSPSRRRDHRR